MKKFLALFFLFFFSLPVFAYDFEISGRKLFYNEDELKFYENGCLLSPVEVQSLFEDREVILISEFDKNKKYKFKNSPFKSKKVLLLNDTGRTFHRFFIYPLSSRNQVDSSDKNYAVKSLITIYGKKNVRLKHSGGDEFEIVVK